MPGLPRRAARSGDITAGQLRQGCPP